jgi:rod shape-determining protein MreD
MQYVIAAALAVVAALAEFTIVPHMRIGDAVPHLVLVFGVIWAITGGLEAGMVWAFIGGLALDILGLRPLGVSAFSLLLAIGLASVVGGFLGRVRIIAPVIATAIASPVYSMLLLVTTAALTSAALSAHAFDSVVPSAVYDIVLAAIAGPLTVAIVARRQAAERVDW